MTSTSESLEILPLRERRRFVHAVTPDPSPMMVATGIMRWFYPLTGPNHLGWYATSGPWRSFNHDSVVVRRFSRRSTVTCGYNSISGRDVEVQLQLRHADLARGPIDGTNLPAVAIRRTSQRVGQYGPWLSSSVGRNRGSPTSPAVRGLRHASFGHRPHGHTASWSSEPLRGMNFCELRWRSNFTVCGRYHGCRLVVIGAKDSGPSLYHRRSPAGSNPHVSVIPACRCSSWSSSSMSAQPFWSCSVPTWTTATRR